MVYTNFRKGGEWIMYVLLNSVDKVKSFVSHVTKLDLDLYLVSGRYIVDAKSIMGIFSLDLSKPIRITELDKYSEDKIKEIVDKYLYRG